MKKNSNSLEYLLEELKKITDKLESNETSIDESIELFEKGNVLLKKSKEKLEKIKLKIHDFEDIKNENQNEE
jgi:exodeoxyribonuclease VII small subunit